MPIEIKELIIRAIVVDDDNMDNEQTGDDELTEINKQAIISTCVEEVLKIINRKEER